MLKKARSCVLVDIVLMLLAAVNCRLVQAADAAVDVDRKTTEASLFDDGRLVLRYRCADVPYKPYVDQLFSPAGVQILRDHVPDHVHHHALMFALSVDGVNFWEEVATAAGTEESGLLTVDNTDGRKRPGFEQVLYWMGPNGKWLLDERRHVTSFGSPVDGATLVTWRSHLELPAGKDSAELGGHHYFGLGMRFVQSMDKGGRFFNADDKEGEVVRGTEKLTRTKWCAYTAKADGKPVTVAIFDSPKNFRRATMFTMTAPFAYLSATLNVWKEPITLKAGHPIDLSYGVALWDGAVGKAAVEKLYRRWADGL